MKGFDMSSTAWAIVIVAIVAGVGAIVLDKFQGQTTNGSTAYEVIGQGLSALNTYAQFLGIVAVSAAAAVILYLIYGAFSGGGESL